MGDGRLIGTEELSNIMRDNPGLNFDAARVELTRRQMIRAGVDPNTGLPLDGKLVAW
jgi:hypothetical protein